MRLALPSHHPPKAVTGKARGRRLIIVGVAAVSGTVASCTAWRSARHDDSLRARFELLTGAFLAQQRPVGFALGVVDRKRMIYEHYAGVERLPGGPPVSRRSNFHVASLSKSFVATAVLQLVGSHGLDLDSTLITYLPYFRLKDPRFREITIRQVLNHTSGIPDLGADSNYHWDKPETDELALERFVRSLSDRSLLHTPGASYRYSNIGYDVLGAVIARVSHQSFEDYVARHVLVPTGMVHSTFGSIDTTSALLAMPHVRPETRPADRGTPSPVYPYNRAHSPSSTLKSSVADMARWAVANLNRGQIDGAWVLPASAYNELWKPSAPVDVDSSGSPTRQTGLGWFLTSSDGHRLVDHRGADIGFRSYILLAPDDGFGVVVLANDEVDPRALRGLAQSMLNALLHS